MNVITAPESFEGIIEPCCFLAGGIQNCETWQNSIIEMLKDQQKGVLFNPRRENFPIHDPNAAKQQITWEFFALQRADIFSMFFCKGPSDQPICMYEFGRHLAIHRMFGDIEKVVICVEPGYKRAQDVYIQTELVSPKLAAKISTNLEQHAHNILEAMRNIE